METPLDGTGQKNRSRNNAARLRMPKILESPGDGHPLSREGRHRRSSVLFS